MVYIGPVLGGVVQASGPEEGPACEEGEGHVPQSTNQGSGLPAG